MGLTIKRVEDRLHEHNTEQSRYTKTYAPWELVYFETFYCRLCAEKRKQFLKSGIGFKIRKHLLKLELALDIKSSSLKNGV